MASKDSTLSAKQARELLSYSPDTGTIRWVWGRSRSGSAGGVAGTPTSDGYRVIKIDGRAYLAHRIAWLITYGKWPEGRVDHVNGEKSDNRLTNLSVTTVRDRLKGVYRCEHLRSNPWMARIMVNGARRNLGCFPTPELAHAAYLEARRESSRARKPSKSKDPYSAILKELNTFPTRGPLRGPLERPDGAFPDER